MINLQLFFEFLKIGLFAVGGGMATLPFLHNLGEATGWFDEGLITNMIAISESTPGPIGINMATYVGYNVAGIPGGILATLGEVIPSIIIVILISKSLQKFRNNKYIDYAFYGLRPAVTGLIAAAAISVIKVSIFTFSLYEKTGNFVDLINIKKLMLFVVMFYAIRKFKKHPVLYIAIAAVTGVIFAF